MSKFCPIDVTTVTPSSIPLVTMLCRTAGISNIINHMVAWNEANSRISPGLLIETLIICILCGRRPLWKVHQFWAAQDMATLFPEVDISWDQLNDDAYGRALDKLAEIDMEALVSQVALTMLAAHDLTINCIHLDTTSKSVQGLYEGELHQDFDINRGHSKDKRPDLKQFKLGLGVQQQGQVVMGQMLSGNKADVKWNPEAVLKMKDFFDNKGFKEVVFVSDCALVSTEALRKLARKNIQFISRLPQTFALAEQLKTRAWEENNWHDIGTLSTSKPKQATHYKTFPIQHELDGQLYDFVVVHSSSLEAQKEKTVIKRLAKEKEKLQKEATRLYRQSFACEPDALAALDSFLTEARKQGFDVQGEVEVKTTSTHGRRGRPKNGEEPQVTVTYHANCAVGEVTPRFFEHLVRMEATFVLIARVKDRNRYDHQGILAEYKRQISVEQKFRFLKSPVYLGPVFLKTKKRVHALGYVFIVALLVISYLEYRVRKSLKERSQVLIWPRGYKNDRPSVQTIFEVLDLIKVLIVNGERYFPKNIDRQALKMVEWAGFDPADVYLKHLPMSVIG